MVAEEKREDSYHFSLSIVSRIFFCRSRLDLFEDLVAKVTVTLRVLRLFFHHLDRQTHSRSVATEPDLPLLKFATARPSPL